MKLSNQLPTLAQMVEISGKGELQATGHTLGNSIDVLVIGYNKSKNKVVARHETFGSNLSGLIVQIDRIVKRLNCANFEIVVSK